LFALDAAADLGAVAFPGLGVLSFLVFLVLIPVFIVWFYRARKNADGQDWKQRWGPGWAIGAWFVPVIALWFPYQIMADIWRAGLRPGERRRPAWPPIIWWAGWLLAWFTSFRYVSTTSGTYHGTSVGLYLGDTVLSKIFEAAAAIAAIVVVRAVSNHGVGLEVGPGHTSPA
jgi:Domain of unknown function (DUF4328)